MAWIKKACARANRVTGALSSRVAEAIERACDELIDGKLHDQFIVDPIQGGAGTSTNMNANEVIANRAIELLGGVKGDYTLVHPNDHVNCGQSTNDIYPTCVKMTLYRASEGLQREMEALVSVLEKRAADFDGVIKMGRTQLQDAVPIRLGQEFSAYAAVMRRERARLERGQKELLVLNLGGTAVGTGINASAAYIGQVVPILSEMTGISFTQSPDLVDATQNTDCYLTLSAALKKLRCQPVQNVQRSAAHVLRPPRRAGRDQPARPAERLLHHAGQGESRDSRGGQPDCLPGDRL